VPPLLVVLSLVPIIVPLTTALTLMDSSTSVYGRGSSGQFLEGKVISNSVDGQKVARPGGVDEALL